MKEIIRPITILSLLLPALACGRGEASALRELLLEPVAEHLLTKSDPELSGVTLGTDNSYVIYASASSELQPYHFTGQLFSYTGAGCWEASSAPGTAAPVYWPAGGASLDFLACALTPAAQAALSISWDAAAPANGLVISDWDTYENQFDVMYAAACDRTPGSAVPLRFQHSLAVVAFSASCTVPGVFTLNRITLNGLGYRGTLTVDNSRTELTADWGTLAAGDRVAFKTDGTTDDYGFVVPGESARCTRHLLVPPQPARSVTLGYSLGGVDFTHTLALPRTHWKAGCEYDYTLRFTLSEITADPAVSPWDIEVSEQILP